MHTVRAATPRPNHLATCEFATIRERLIKIGATRDRASRTHLRPTAHELNARGVVPRCRIPPGAVQPVSTGAALAEPPTTDQPKRVAQRVVPPRSVRSDR